VTWITTTAATTSVPPATCSGDSSWPSHSHAPSAASTGSSVAAIAARYDLTWPIAHR
jgi:hypothetical protein